MVELLTISGNLFSFNDTEGDRGLRMVGGTRLIWLRPQYREVVL